MSRGQPELVRIQLEKATDTPMLAVEVYNKPATKFRSGGFIVLMSIAWTSMFHATEGQRVALIDAIRNHAHSTHYFGDIA